MNNANKIKNRGFALMLVIASQFIAFEAQATDAIYGQAIGLKVIPVTPTTTNTTKCMACHAVPAGAKADKNNLKPGVKTAWSANKTTLSTLKTLLNTLPTTTVGAATSGVAKTDVYEVYCVAPATSLTASVADLKSQTGAINPALVSIQIKKGTAVSPLKTDPVDGDAGFSPVTTLAGGVGPYTVNVTKSASTTVGAETYKGLLSCKNGTAAVGVAWRLVTNN
jgi:hypothetical protein